MTPAAGRQGRLVGFDWLRGFALFLVVLRHVLEVTNLPVTRDVLVLDQGQLGVALFCAMAGFFALGGHQPVGRWALDRARRLYPAYWIVTAALFAANAVTSYKPASLSLFISQMLGLGYFTHGGEHLINVPSWYLSLILTCYVIAAVVRSLPRRRPVLTALLVLSVVVVAFKVQTDFTRQIVAFLGGMSLRTLAVPALSGRWRVGLIILLAGVPWLWPDLGYAAWALAAMLIAEAAAWRDGFIVRFIADHSYEVFLVHGPIVVLFVRMIHLPLPWALGLALVATVVAAIALHRAVDWLEAVAARGRSSPSPVLIAPPR
jgi:peptidoglycan/LPS O-acetylase OafA/YrhL